MKLKGDYSDLVPYDVGDLVLFNDTVFHKQKPCEAGIPPTDTKYWSRANQTISDMVRIAMDAVSIAADGAKAMDSRQAKSIQTKLEKRPLRVQSASGKLFDVSVSDAGKLIAKEVGE